MLITTLLVVPYVVAYTVTLRLCIVLAARRHNYWLHVPVCTYIEQIKNEITTTIVLAAPPEAYWPLRYTLTRSVNLRS